MKNSFLLKLVNFLASGFYSGYAPIASGTFGTLAASLLYFIYNYSTGHGPTKLTSAILALLTFVIGLICCKIALDNKIYPSNDDPSQIVIDEFAGFFTAMAFVETNFKSIIIVFFCFRFFDILKPTPAKQADQIDGAVGIMLDDIFAGIYAGLFSVIILFYFHPLAANAQNLEEEFKVNYLPLTNGKLIFSYEKGEDADIYYIDFSKEIVKPVATGPNKQIYPNWSPDGQQVAYVESSQDKSQIIVINLSNGNKISFSSSDNLNHPSWSPDGKKIVSSSASTSSLYTIDLNSAKVDKLLTPAGGKKYGSPAWSPRGNEIIFTTTEFWPGLDLILLDLKNKKPFTLTSGYQDFFSPSWHPSGGSFLALYGVKNDIEIWEFNKGFDAPEILFTREGQEADPIWSEDGEIVLFTGETPVNSNKFQAYIWIKSQGKIHQLTNANGSIKNLSWSPITD